MEISYVVHGGPDWAVIGAVGGVVLGVIGSELIARSRARRAAIDAAVDFAFALRTAGLILETVGRGSPGLDVMLPAELLSRLGHRLSDATSLMTDEDARRLHAICTLYEAHVRLRAVNRDAAADLIGPAELTVGASLLEAYVKVARAAWWNVPAWRSGAAGIAAARAALSEGSLEHGNGEELPPSS